MGGLIGMMLAAQAESPIARLIVNDVGPFIPKDSLRRLAAYVGKAPRFDTVDQFEQYLRTICAPFGHLTDAQWRHLAEHSYRKNDDGSFTTSYDPAIGNAFPADPQDVNLWPVWDAIRCPTLILRGKESDLLLRRTAEEMSERGPKAQMVEFDGIGHAPMLMSEDQIAVVRRFLLG
jgi:pimeloyl-ACP methyl ester carboxylesterase